MLRDLSERRGAEVARLQVWPKDEPTPADTAAYEQGAKDMKAACWEAVALRLQFHGLWHRRDDFRAAIEGAAP
jgi:hypothetical protein